MRNLLLALFMLCATVSLNSGVADEQTNLYSPELYEGIPAFAKENILYDDFENNDKGWHLGFEDGLVLDISEGYYLVSATGDQPRVLPYGLKIDENRDFEIEIVMIFISGPDESFQYLTWGLADPNNYHRFYFQNAGAYRINSFIEGKWKSYTPRRESELVKDREPVKLTVRKYGKSDYFFLNEQLVHKMPHLVFLGDKLGFCVGKKSTIRVDTLRVSMIK